LTIPRKTARQIINLRKRHPFIILQTIYDKMDKRVCLSTIWRTLNHNGIPPKSVLNKEMVIQLREAHPDWSIRAIASQSHVKRARVYQILSEAGLPTRGEGIVSGGKPILKLSSSQISSLVADHKKDMPNKDLCRKYKIAYSTVRRYLSKHIITEK